MRRPPLISYFSRFIYSRRALPQRALRVFLRQPVLVDLGDFKMYVSLDDWLIGARIFVKRSYEKHVADVLRPMLHPGNVVLDLGANLGYFTLLAAARVGRTGKVIAFEPNPFNGELLQKSVEYNGFHNVELHQLAVSDANEWVGLEMEGSNGVMQRAAREDSSMRVQTIVLDEFLENEPRLDLVKMDIEGAEPLALRGMRQRLMRHRPLLFTELHPELLRRVSNTTPLQYLDTLRELGYDLYIIHRDRGRNPTPQTNDEILRDLEESPFDHLELMGVPLPSTIPATGQIVPTTREFV